MELFIVLAWVGLSIAAGFYAIRLNRSGPLWGMAAVLVSPLLAFVFLLALGERHVPDDEEERIPCPFCAEQILPAAILCPHLPERSPAVHAA